MAFSSWEIVLLMFAALGVINLGEGIMQRFKPKPPPRKWKVNFHAPDGFPMQDYSLNEKQIAKVMAMIHHELDHASEGKNG
jgi:hypothetical protein